MHKKCKKLVPYHPIGFHKEENHLKRHFQQVDMYECLHQ